MAKENEYEILGDVKLRDLDKDEIWLHEVINKKPAVLGLGDLVVVDRERYQPTGGRIDMLLANDSGQRFEIEIQLGSTDETHIIRTIEYWDIERRRYPATDHVAVIAAEEITGRFFNVINLFGNHIPLVALKVSAFKLPKGRIGLHFFKVLDTRDFVSSIAESDVGTEVTDEGYWIKKSTKDQVGIAKKIISDCFHSTPNYNKFYIGIDYKGAKIAKVVTKPRKKYNLLEFSTTQNDDTDKILEDNAVFVNYQQGAYLFRVSTVQDIEENKNLFKNLFQQATGIDLGEGG